MTRYQDGGEALLEAFRGLGIDYVFCSSGSEWAPIWEAVTRQGIENRAGPAYLDFMHETLAVGMAIGYTLVTGRIQAVLLHATAGVLQGANGIHGALLTNVPMLVMSSEATSYGERESVDPGSQWYRNLSFVGGPHSMIDRVVKWSCQVPGIETLYEFVKRAGELSQRKPAGPVYLNAAVEVLLAPWERPETAKSVPPPGARVAPAEDIEALVGEIAAARAPIVITESVGRAPGGQSALIAFAEAFNIPVYEGRGCLASNFPMDNPLYQGIDPTPARDETDLLLLVNCRAPYYPPSNVFPKAKVIVIDEAPQRPHMVYQVLNADRYIEGDVPATLRAAAARTSGDTAARRKKAEDSHAGYLAKITEARRKAAEEDGLSPIHCTARLRQALPDDALIFDETTTHSNLVRQHLRSPVESTYSYVQGGLGQGIGVALGAKLAARDRFVVLAVGDGAFLYNPIVQALAASREYDLPILIVVYNNKIYRSMKNNYLRFYPDGQGVETDRFHGIDLSAQPALEKLGESCGVRGIAVEDKAELDTAIAEAIACVQGGTTCILNLHVSR